MYLNGDMMWYGYTFRRYLICWLLWNVWGFFILLHSAAAATEIISRYNRKSEKCRQNLSEFSFSAASTFKADSPIFQFQGPLPSSPGLRATRNWYCKGQGLSWQIQASFLLPSVGTGGEISLRNTCQRESTHKHYCRRRNLSQQFYTPVSHPPCELADKFLSTKTIF